MNNSNLSFGYIAERDIDLLLLEEAYTSDSFLKWLLSHTNIPLHVNLKTAKISVSQATGESDLELWFIDEKGNEHIILLENKINANFQLNQATRYHQRGLNYSRNSLAGSFTTILTAPNKFLESCTENFDLLISYEDLIDWLKVEYSASDNKRLNFKVTQLQRAIEKYGYGYARIEDFAVSSFWSNYYKLLDKIAPELPLNRIDGRPSRSIWANFRIPHLKGRFLLVHKTDKGYVDFQIPHGASKPIKFRNALKLIIEDGMTIEFANKSLAIRKRCPLLDPSRPFGEQAESVYAAINICKEMYTWVDNHSEDISSMINEDFNTSEVNLNDL